MLRQNFELIGCMCMYPLYVVDRLISIGRVMVTYELMKTVRVIAVELCESFNDGVSATADTVHSAAETVQWTVWGATVTAVANMIVSSPAVLAPVAKMLGW